MHPPALAPPGAPLSRSQRPPPSARAPRARLALQLSRRLLGHPGSVRSWPQPPRPEEPTAGAAWRGSGQSTRPGPRAGPARRRARRHQPRGAAPPAGSSLCRSPAALPAPQPRAGSCLFWPKLSLRTLRAARPDWHLGFNALKSSLGALGLEGLFRLVWLLSVLQDRGRPSRRPRVLPLSPRSREGARPRSGAAGRATWLELLPASAAGLGTQAGRRWRSLARSAESVAGWGWGSPSVSPALHSLCRSSWGPPGRGLGRWLPEAPARERRPGSRLAL